MGNVRLRTIEDGVIRMERAKHFKAVALAVSMLFLGAAGAADAPAAKKVVKAGTFCETQDARECQEAVTPQLILERFKQGNARFASGTGTRRDYLRQDEATAAGQYPLASIVSCIDSRVPAESVFDQGIVDRCDAGVAANAVNGNCLID